MFFVIAGILVLIILVGLAVGLIGGKGEGIGAAAIGIVVLVIFTAFMSFTTVEPRSVGVQTSFGKYQDTLENGTQAVAPWSQVEEFSTQVQPLQLAVPVSFDGGSSGTVVLTNLWAIDGPQVKALWDDFKTFERVNDLLVKPSTETAVAAAFSAYSPQDARNGGNRTKLQTDIKTALSGENNDGGVFAGRGVLVDSIQITDVQLDGKAQAAVDRVTEATANTQRATEEQERARIEAETAKIRQESQTPEALQRYCLEVVNNWDAAKNGNLPATFNCVFGETGQTPVIIGQ